MPRASEVCLDPELASTCSTVLYKQDHSQILGGTGGGVDAVSQWRELQSHSRRVWLQGKAENQGHFCSICHGNDTLFYLFMTKSFDSQR